MQINSEFTNFSHQEFPGNEFSKGTSEPETIIPRLDNIESGRKGDVKKEPLDERIVPIKLMETGETLMPTFTQLEDPKLPEWSTFNSLNKAPEREVPLKTQHQKHEQQHHEQQNHEQKTEQEQKQHKEQQNHEQQKEQKQDHQKEQQQEQQRGRDRSRNQAAPTAGSTTGAPSSPKTSTTGRSPSASGKKNSVRFDLDNHQTSPPIRREEKTTTERRSSSVETFTRKTSTTSTSSKPPTIPKKSSNTTPSKSTPWRTASTERPASAMAMSPKTERTLQEIDRDINQIWQELQELEKLPNGTYRPRRPSAGSTGGPTGRSASPGGVAKSPGGVAKPNLPPAAAVPVTPVRVKATYTASAATPTKYSTHDPPPSRATPPVGVATYPVGVSTPNTQRRTIWDMDSEMPTAGGPAVVQCSKSNPVTPQVAKKIELPPRAPQTVVPASGFSVAAAPPSHNAPSSAKTAHDRPPLPNCGMRPLAQPPLPPIPPHMRPQHIKMAPMARDESFYDLGSTKSPASEASGGLTTPSSAYDNNEYSPASGKFKGFPYIDGAPRKRSESPSNKQNNNFSLLVDKSSQTDGDASAMNMGTPNSNNDHNAETNA